MITKEQFIKNVRNKNPKADSIDFNGEFTGINNPINCTCRIDGYSWNPVAYSMYRNGCPVCANKIIIKGINDLWTTHPHIAKLLTNEEDGYNVTFGVAKKKMFTCPCCGSHVIQAVNEVAKRNRISCKSCDDNISFPNKVMYNLLTQLDIDFETEKTFDWATNINGNKVKYDFFIENKNTIIEMHGIQHYLRPVNKKGRKLNQEQENDRFKQEAALNNDINNYIVIDARYSECDYIKENIIKSELSKILNLTNIDWEEVFLKSSESFIPQIANLWNDGMNITNICSKTHFTRSFIRKCLIKAAYIKLCDYTPTKSINRKIHNISKKVICIEDKQVYESIEEAGKALGVSANTVGRCCDLHFESLVSVKRKHCLFYNDFINMSINEIADILKRPITSNAKPLYCIEEDRIFNNVQEIHDWCGVCHRSIREYLKGNIDYAGTHPLTNQKLHWRTVTDNDIISSYDLTNLKEKFMYA